MSKGSKIILGVWLYLVLGLGMGVHLDERLKQNCNESFTYEQRAAIIFGWGVVLPALAIATVLGRATGVKPQPCGATVP